jgi:hypothetical protein
MIKIQMGNGCEKCCSNVDDPTEFFDDPKANNDIQKSAL